jgi:hypothetical protein
LHRRQPAVDVALAGPIGGVCASRTRMKPAIARRFVVIPIV